ncbi:MAG: glycine zipper domain-containing protein [Burkholderiales bacterium]
MQNTGMQGSTPGATATGRYAENVADKATESLGRLTETAQQAMERLSDVASQTANRLSEKGQELWDMRGQAADTARSYVREHPIATIGIAIAIGLLISRLTSRR